jgi:hypothetical protein
MTYMNSRTSFIHIGLPLDHPSIPKEIQEKAGPLLNQIRDQMLAEGYDYEFAFASPEIGLRAFKSQLEAHPPDGVVTGGGRGEQPPNAVLYGADY